jgi:hypothetical protein
MVLANQNAKLTGPDQGFLVSPLVLTLKPWERGWENIIRCHGILLPSDLYFTRLVVLRGHEQVMHNGIWETLTQVRSNYWITWLRGRLRRPTLWEPRSTTTTRVPFEQRFCLFQDRCRLRMSSVREGHIQSIERYAQGLHILVHLGLFKQ